MKYYIIRRADYDTRTVSWEACTEPKNGPGWHPVPNTFCTQGLQVCIDRLRTQVAFQNENPEEKVVKELDL